MTDKLNELFSFIVMDTHKTAKSTAETFNKISAILQEQDPNTIADWFEQIAVANEACLKEGTGVVDKAAEYCRILFSTQKRFDIQAEVVKRVITLTNSGKLAHSKCFDQCQISIEIFPSQSLGEICVFTLEQLIDSENEELQFKKTIEILIKGINMMTGKSEQIGIITKTTTLKTTTACREYLTESLASTKWKQSDVVPLINAFKDLDLSARDVVVFSKSIIKILRKSPVDCLEDLTIAALQFVQRKSAKDEFLSDLIKVYEELEEKEKGSAELLRCEDMLILALSDKYNAFTPTRKTYPELTPLALAVLLALITKEQHVVFKVLKDIFAQLEVLSSKENAAYARTMETVHSFEKLSDQLHVRWSRLVPQALILGTFLIDNAKTDTSLSLCCGVILLNKIFTHPSKSIRCACMQQCAMHATSTAEISRVQNSIPCFTFSPLLCEPFPGAPLCEVIKMETSYDTIAPLQGNLTHALVYLSCFLAYIKRYFSDEKRDPSESSLISSSLQGIIPILPNETPQFCHYFALCCLPFASESGSSLINSLIITAKKMTFSPEMLVNGLMLMLSLGSSGSPEMSDTVHREIMFTLGKCLEIEQRAQQIYDAIGYIFWFRKQDKARVYNESFFQALAGLLAEKLAEFKSVSSPFPFSECTALQQRNLIALIRVSISFAEIGDDSSLKDILSDVTSQFSECLIDDTSCFSTAVTTEIAQLLIRFTVESDSSSVSKSTVTICNLFQLYVNILDQESTAQRPGKKRKKEQDGKDGKGASFFSITPQSVLSLETLVRLAIKTFGQDGTSNELSSQQLRDFREFRYYLFSSILSKLDVFPSLHVLMSLISNLNGIIVTRSAEECECKIPRSLSILYILCECFNKAFHYLLIAAMVKQEYVKYVLECFHKAKSLQDVSLSLVEVIQSLSRDCGAHILPLAQSVSMINSLIDIQKDSPSGEQEKNEYSKAVDLIKVNYSEENPSSLKNLIKLECNCLTGEALVNRVLGIAVEVSRSFPRIADATESQQTQATEAGNEKQDGDDACQGSEPSALKKHTITYNWSVEKAAAAAVVLVSVITDIISEMSRSTKLRIDGILALSHKARAEFFARFRTVLLACYCLSRSKVGSKSLRLELFKCFTGALSVLKLCVSEELTSLKERKRNVHKLAKHFHSFKKVVNFTLKYLVPSIFLFVSDAIEEIDDGFRTEKVNLPALICEIEELKVSIIELEKKSGITFTKYLTYSTARDVRFEVLHQQTQQESEPKE